MPRFLALPAADGLFARLFARGTDRNLIFLSPTADGLFARLFDVSYEPSRRSHPAGGAKTGPHKIKQTGAEEGIGNGKYTYPSPVIWTHSSRTVVR